MKKKICIMALLATIACVGCEKEPMTTSAYEEMTITKGNGNGNGRGQNNGRGGEHANENARGRGVTSQRGEGPAFGEYTITITVGTEGMEDGGTVTDGDGGTGSGTEVFVNGEIILM